MYYDQFSSRINNLKACSDRCLSCLSTCDDSCDLVEPIEFHGELANPVGVNYDDNLIDAAGQLERREGMGKHGASSHGRKLLSTGTTEPVTNSPSNDDRRGFHHVDTFAKIIRPAVVCRTEVTSTV